mmetsp:Transcript_44301/g.73304  ORF Transcript_44301/g.73304 Transcript_44301/m.73304 type:complete len:160 (-) Transcript_44301:417-896(-)
MGCCCCCCCCCGGACWGCVVVAVDPFACCWRCAGCWRATADDAAAAALLLHCCGVHGSLCARALHATAATNSGLSDAECDAGDFASSGESGSVRSCALVGGTLLTDILGDSGCTEPWWLVSKLWTWSCLEEEEEQEEEEEDEEEEEQDEEDEGGRNPAG